MSEPGRHAGRGRPVATTPADIERVAFDLFASRGFAATTMENIAQAAGVSRRTLFRYFDSKNDIPWGQFDLTLERFRQVLAEMPEGMALHEAVARGVIAFNDFPAEAQSSHRLRMQLILTTPELQAHSVLRYSAWRSVIVEFVAQRTGRPRDALLPQVVGHVSLALAVSAYEAWLDMEDTPIGELLIDALAALRDFLGDEPTVGYRGIRSTVPHADPVTE